MSKKIKYKGVTVNKQDNISLNFVNKVVDELGKDYCFDVDSLINFLSKQSQFNNHP